MKKNIQRMMMIRSKCRQRVLTQNKIIVSHIKIIRMKKSLTEKTRKKKIKKILMRKISKKMNINKWK